MKSIGHKSLEKRSSCLQITKSYLALVREFCTSNKKILTLQVGLYSGIFFWGVGAFFFHVASNVN